MTMSVRKLVGKIWLDEVAATRGIVGRADRKESVVSAPSPAAITSPTLPKRTPLPITSPFDRRWLSTGA